LIIAVIGGRQSGKTTAVETIIRGFVRKGLRVSAVKHISEEDFTMDTEQKDTWRYTQSGAQTVVGIAPHEVAIIKKGDTSKFTLKQVTETVGNNFDLLILEGFRKLVEKERTVQKVVAAKTKDEALEAAKRFKPILAFVGSFPAQTTVLRIPYINPLKEPDKLVNLVYKQLEDSEAL
jgi:molybdopterin-guanine dinucleotide biosynthesis protein MobB